MFDCPALSQMKLVWGCWMCGMAVATLLLLLANVLGLLFHVFFECLDKLVADLRSW